MVCPNCKKLSPLGQTHKGCKTKYGLDGLVSIYKYTGTVRELIGKLKYGYVKDIGNVLTDHCVSNLANCLIFKKPILVPIPLSGKRERWRGLNQTEIMGEKIAHQLDWDYQPFLVKRIMNRRPQVGLKNEERLRNICGIFAVNRQVAGKINQSKTVVLFDDVWTSGSTIKEACKELKKAGFRTVWGLTIAR